MLSFTERLIGPEHFVEHNHQRPAIQKKVMKAPDQVMLTIAEFQKGNSHQRCQGQVKTRLLVTIEEENQPALLLFWTNSAPVLFSPRQCYVAINDLVWLLEILPMHAGTEHVVTIQHVLPGTSKYLGIEPAAKAASHLLKVDVAIRSVQRVEKHALLQRGKLVDILQVLRWFHLALPETDRPSFGSRFLKSSALILAAMKSTAVNAELSDRVSSSRRPATKSWASCSISSSENWSALY